MLYGVPRKELWQSGWLLTPPLVTPPLNKRGPKKKRKKKKATASASLSVIER